MKISIEGNIGSGKSSILSRLCQEARIPVFMEPVDDWKEWLGLFYSDPSRWGMAFNTKVLLSFSDWKDINFKSVYERSPISNRHVFSQLQHESGCMTKLELEMFSKIYYQLAWVPDVIIYLRTEPSVSMSRMNNRGRECEKNVDINYMAAVHEKYEAMLNGVDYLAKQYTTDIKQQACKRDDSMCKVIMVDGNKSHDDVYQDVLAHITQCLQLEFLLHV